MSVDNVRDSFALVARVYYSPYEITQRKRLAERELRSCGFSKADALVAASVAVRALLDGPTPPGDAVTAASAQDFGEHHV